MVSCEVFGQSLPKLEVGVLGLHRGGCARRGGFGVAAVFHFNDFFRREANEGILREFSWAFSGFEEVTIFGLVAKCSKCLDWVCGVPKFLKL